MSSSCTFILGGSFWHVVLTFEVSNLKLALLMASALVLMIPVLELGLDLVLFSLQRSSWLSAY